MDDDYDIDEYDEELEDLDFDDEDDNPFEEDDFLNDDEPLDDDEIELAGYLDGESDASGSAAMYGSYGISVGLDRLTDEQKDLYDTSYHAGQM